MNLNLETLAIAAFAMALALTASLTVMGLFLRGQPGLRSWVQSLWFATLGVIALGLRGKIPEFLSVLMGNSGLALSAAFTWKGMREFCGRPDRMRSLALPLAGLYILIISFFLFVHPSRDWRSLFLSLMNLTIDSSMAWTLYRHGPSELIRSTRMMSLLFLVEAIYNGGVFTLRGIELLSPDWLPTHSLDVMAYLAAILFGTLKVLGYMILLSHKLLTELGRMARSDGLTGVMNRRTLMEEAALMLEFCFRQKLPCSLILSDLDHFKQLNDRLGHSAGDEALRHFAGLIKAELRKTDLFGRYGGEEFCILMPGVAIGQAAQVAERLRLLVESRPVGWAGRFVPVTVSMGVAGYDGSGPADFSALFDRADQAMYRAKRLGRNRVESGTLPLKAGEEEKYAAARSDGIG